jgi:hypothetical protein
VRPLRPWMLIAAYALGALTFGPEPALPNLPGIGWLLPIASPAPFKADKLTVVVLHDSAHVGEVPAWVDGADESAVRGWTEKQGGEFRLLDKNSKPDLLGDKWKAALAAPHGETPWIMAATPRRGISEHLPGKREDALAHLAPLGGS